MRPRALFANMLVVAVTVGLGVVGPGRVADAKSLYKIVHASVKVLPNTTGSVIADCGQDAPTPDTTGGGALIKGEPSNVHLEQSSGGEGTWRASAFNGGSKSEKLTAYAICAPHNSVTELVHATGVSVPPGGTASLQIGCFSGDVAVGGGGPSSARTGFVLIASKPVDAALSDGVSDAWSATVYNSSGTTQNLQTVVDCVTPAGRTFTTYNSVVEKVKNFTGTVEAPCPKGSVATGGGAEILSGNTGQGLVSTYPKGKTKWTASWQHGPTTPGSLKTYVVCETLPS